MSSDDQTLGKAGNSGLRVKRDVKPTFHRLPPVSCFLIARSQGSANVTMTGPKTESYKATSLSKAIHSASR